MPSLQLVAIGAVFVESQPYSSFYPSFPMTQQVEVYTLPGTNYTFGDPCREYLVSLSIHNFVVYRICVDEHWWSVFLLFFGKRFLLGVVQLVTIKDVRVG